MQPRGGGFFFLLYNDYVHVIVHDCTVIIIHVHVHVSGPVDGSKRHIFELISLAY